jgi:AcrR family transcriptional regulator
MPRIKGRKPETTREAVLEAAIWAFAEYGFDNATLAIIANRAGVTAATLPYHFSDKKGLWDAVIDAFYKELFAFATTIGANEDLEGIVPRFYDWSQKHRNGIRVIIRNVIETGALDREVREVRMGSAFDLVSQIAVRRYQVDPTQARDATIAVTHLVTRFVTNSPEDNRRAFNVATDAEARQRIVTILLRTAKNLMGLPAEG